MTTPGTGGLPVRRLDQQANYQPPTQAPGAAAGVTRTRIVEIIGGTGSGIFVYSGAPAAGNLIASLVGATTADPFGNTVVPDGLTFYNGAQLAFFGLVGAENELFMGSGASFEGQAFEVAATAVGSGGTAFITGGMVGPAADTPGHNDFAEISLNSGQENGGSVASGQLIYVAPGGPAVATAFWNDNGFTMNGIVNGMDLQPTSQPTLGTSGFGGGIWTAAQQAALLTLQAVANGPINSGVSVGFW